MHNSDFRAEAVFCIKSSQMCYKTIAGKEVWKRKSDDLQWRSHPCVAWNSPMDLLAGAQGCFVFIAHRIASVRSQEMRWSITHQSSAKGKGKMWVVYRSNTKPVKPANSKWRNLWRKERKPHRFCGHQLEHFLAFTQSAQGSGLRVTSSYRYDSVLLEENSQSFVASLVETDIIT